MQLVIVSEFALKNSYSRRSQSWIWQCCRVGSVK